MKPDAFAALRFVVLALALPSSSGLGSLGCGGGEATGSEESDLSAPTHFTNPVIPMFMRPAGVPASEPSQSPDHPTEGCPDPSALRTHAGGVYIYCTSYTFPYGRLDGFPIFKSKSNSLAGPFARVSSLIPDGGPSRSTWPAWVKDGHGRRDGSFWGPDVHELPNGKFLAGYSAPCGAKRCVGIAWSDHPEGPWTHGGAPFISPSNNLPPGRGTPDSSYDPSLLITNTGALYLYWVVVGEGVFGARVSWKSGGGLKAVDRSDVHVIADRARAGQRGEGPYVIEHAGAFYEFYSTGSLLYGYFVGVRRGTNPLGVFDQEGPSIVVEHNADDHFVATGGNSVVQDAVSGTDMLVYHAIEVPAGGGCPRRDPENGSPVKEDSDNPHCRVQGERQAMIDPIEWTDVQATGIEWPVLKNHKGTPSVGKTSMP